MRTYPGVYGFLCSRSHPGRQPVVSMLFIEFMHSFSSGREHFPQVVLVGVQGISL